MSWPKKCSGCDRLISKPSWQTFQAIGTQHFPDEEPLELRNCPACGSTLAVRESVAKPHSDK